MPIFERRPNLASLVVPPSGGFGYLEGVKTPIPHTPMACSPIEAAMVMTPDTPGFNMPSIENALSQNQRHETAWTEQEDELLGSYLSHPPRPLRNTYPPHSLPPHEALEELVAQILSSPAWPAYRTPLSTRSRLAEIARQRVTAYQAGPKREPLNVLPNVPARKTARPRLTVGAGQFGLSRQQHSMDSLYGDNESATFSEALRLSSTLQDTASTGTTEELGSVGSLSSPLDFTFTFNSTAPAPAAKPFGLSTGPRPTSLLQRGRSFTGQDLVDVSMTQDDASSGEDEPMQLDSHGRNPSSPESSFTTSPPSSVSSHTMDDVEELAQPVAPVAQGSNMGYFGLTRSGGMGNIARGFGTLQDVEIEPEPFTPLNATFFGAVTPLNPPSGGSSGGMSTPAITLTVNSPTMSSDTPRLLAASTTTSRSSSGQGSPTSTARALANLSLNSRHRNPPPAPGPVRRTRVPSVTLSRSLSDGMLAGPVKPHSNVISQSTSLSRLSEHCDSSDHRGHQLARPMVKRQKSNTPELSVFVPRPAGKNWTDELKSPFEHKPAGSGSGSNGLGTPIMSCSSANSSTATLTAGP